MEVLSHIDREALRAKVRSASPFPHFCVDNLLAQDFAEQVCESFPPFEVATKLGKTFSSVNERRKIQIVDSRRFPPPLQRLNEALACRDFLDLMSYVFDIPNLLADEELAGGGIHQTGPQGRLDVHVDFNYIEKRALHRRLNILIYFNKRWREEWGGNIELWDRDVRVCHHSFAPIFNRCVVFETSEISFHGVTPVTCPDTVSRKSFAAYYYTKEAPSHWTGESHSTIFRARPDEKLKGAILMPAEKAMRWTMDLLYRGKKSLKRMLTS